MVKKELLKLAGIWKDNPEMVKIMKEIYKNRKNNPRGRFNDIQYSSF